MPCPALPQGAHDRPKILATGIVKELSASPVRRRCARSPAQGGCVTPQR